MERRKLQIKNKVDEITEEKNLLHLNLQKIINQVCSCVDLINSSKRVKQKDCSLILRYELEVLKKITEINFELECVLDDSPLNQLKSCDAFEDYLSVTIQPVESSAAVTLSIEEASLSGLCQEPEFSQTEANTSNIIDIVKKDEPVLSSEDCSDLACSSLHVSDFNEENYNTEIETQSNISDADIQVLRETLKKFSEKLGLNPECFSSMTDFYQKSSDYDKPSSSQIARYEIDSTNLGVQSDTCNGFEYPVKDTNRIVSDMKLNENVVDVLQRESCVLSDNVDTAHSSLFHTACNSELVEDIEDETPTKPEPVKIYTCDDSSSIDFSCMNGIGSNSSEEYVTNEAPHCLIPVVNEYSAVVGNIIDKSHLQTHNNSTETKSSVYTALEKLNNTTFLDRKAEAVAKMQSTEQPDIALKPSEHRIKNDLESNDKKSKKKKNKKGKSKETEFYELMPKSAPRAGMDCAFSFVESPREFYIHVVDDESVRIDSLTDQLNSMFSGTVSQYGSKEEAFNAIGTFCFAFLSLYNSWYRAQILDWELESKSDDVLVQFVDYGDKRRTSYKNLRRLTKELAEIPMLAIRCHLALMYPPQSTSVNRLTQWPTATLDAMMDLSGLLAHGQGERNKIFRIVYADQEEDSVSIDMYNLQDNAESTVGQMLLDLGLAVQIVEELDEEQMELEVFIQDVDGLERADNINEAVMGYDPRDEARICRFTKEDGTCFKGKNCKLEHMPLSKDGFTTDKMLVFKEAMYSLILPAKGESVTILITAYKDVCNFFAQIVHRPHKEKEYLIDDDLYTLLADMNLPRTVRSYETFKIPPAIGEIVTVRHWSNKWLRAVVREEKVGNNDQVVECQVFTLDFGECLSVPLGQLRKIKPHFLKLPFQAVECYLHNNITREDCDAKKAKKFFLENLYYRNFVARTMSVSLPLKLAVTTFDGRDIGKILVDHGFAGDRVCDKNPIDGCCLELY